MKDHIFFDGVEWGTLYKTSAPFKPMVRDVARDRSTDHSSGRSFNSHHFEAHFKETGGAREPESPSMVSLDSNGRGMSTDRSYTEFSFYG